MKKKILAVIVILLALIINVSYLQFGQNMDVVNSMSLNSANYKEENINVVLNKLVVVESKEGIAESIIQHVLDNDFHSIRFSFSGGYPNKLKVSVYKSEKDLKSDNLLFSFTYEQADGEIGEYDISQEEHMKLKISY